MINAEQLFGAWDLVSIERREDDGTVRYQCYQEEQLGQIIYSPDGRMPAQLMSFGTYASYYATYMVDAEQDMARTTSLALRRLTGSERTGRGWLASRTRAT